MFPPPRKAPPRGRIWRAPPSSPRCRRAGSRSASRRSRRPTAPGWPRRAPLSPPSAPAPAPGRETADPSPRGRDGRAARSSESRLPALFVGSRPKAATIANSRPKTGSACAAPTIEAAASPVAIASRELSLVCSARRIRRAEPQRCRGKSIRTPSETPASRQLRTREVVHSQSRSGIEPPQHETLDPEDMLHGRRVLQRCGGRSP